MIGASVAAVAYGGNIAVVVLVHRVLGVNAYLAQLSGIFAYTGVSFLGGKFFGLDTPFAQHISDTSIILHVLPRDGLLAVQIGLADIVVRHLRRKVFRGDGEGRQKIRQRPRNRNRVTTFDMVTRIVFIDVQL